MNTYLFNGEVVTAESKDEVLNHKKVVAKDRSHLYCLISEAINKYGNECDLNFIDVSHVTNMSDLFSMTNGAFGRFNGDISKWNVSNVTNMHNMFERSEFNGDISKWDVNNVKDMSFMFINSKFNGDISNWNVSNVKNMDLMFLCSKIDSKYISKWLPMIEKNGINLKKLGFQIKKDTWDDLEV